MKNKENIKNTFSNIRPSDECTERIFAMTIDNKKASKDLTFKRLASVALALGILVSGGIGVNQVVSKNNQPIDKDKPSAVIQSDLNPLSVMVAYADDYKPVSEITAGSMNDQQIFYSIHFADINDKASMDNAKKQFEEDYNNVTINADKLGDKGFSAAIGKSSGGIYSSKDEKEVGKFYTVRGGAFALNLDDYTDIKSFTVENESKYGELHMACQTKYDNFDDAFNDALDAIQHKIGNKITLTGQELRNSKNCGMFEGGTIHKVNKGYCLNWNTSYELYDAIGNNLNFDLSQIKDTITFTVEFNDGTVKTASLNLYFDSDGYMHFE